MTLNKESDDRNRGPDDYPLMVVRDARQTKRAFEFFDMYCLRYVYVKSYIGYGSIFKLPSPNMLLNSFASSGQ